MPTRQVLIFNQTRGVLNFSVPLFVFADNVSLVTLDRVDVRNLLDTAHQDAVTQPPVCMPFHLYFKDTGTDRICYTFNSKHSPDNSLYISGPTLKDLPDNNTIGPGNISASWSYTPSQPIVMIDAQQDRPPSDKLRTFNIQMSDALDSVYYNADYLFLWFTVHYSQH